MNPACKECGLPFEREPGFYLGSIYFNYGATCLIAGGLFVVAVMGLNISQQVMLGVCLAFTALFPLWFFRYARALFLSLDHYVNYEGTQAGLPQADQQRLSGDDRAAGLVVGLIIGLAILFGLGLAAVTVMSIVAEQ